MITKRGFSGGNSCIDDLFSFNNILDPGNEVSKPRKRKEAHFRAKNIEKSPLEAKFVTPAKSLRSDDSQECESTAEKSLEDFGRVIKQEI